MIDRSTREEDTSAEEQAEFNALMDRYFGFNQSPSHTTYSKEDKEK